MRASHLTCSSARWFSWLPGILLILAGILSPSLLGTQSSLAGEQKTAPPVPPVFRASSPGTGGNSDGATPQIIGGSEAAPGEFPWTAALVEAGEDAYFGQFCGGSLIHPLWVVTAAHCVTDERGRPTPPNSIEVVLGQHDLWFDGDGERLQVMRIIVHPSYNPARADSDIALLELNQPSRQATIAPLRPEEVRLAGAGTLATITGWGSLNPQGTSYPSSLQKANVPIVSNQECNSFQAYNGQVTSNMLCAGYARGGRDACYGDSGGPLVVPNSQRTGWLLAGITSWGEGCGQPNKYGVYTRVSNFTPWISEQLQEIEDAGPLPFHPFDIDANGEVDGTYDGNLIRRYLSGLRGWALLGWGRFIGPGATRTRPREIEAHLQRLIWGR